MNKFIIDANICLSQDTEAFYNTDYTGYRNRNNPDYINELKNLFRDTPSSVLAHAMEDVENVLLNDLPILDKVFKENDFNDVVACMIPRSKVKTRFSRNQFLLKESVSNAINSTNLFTNGLNYIERTVNTRTTHMRKEVSRFRNDGDFPYCGITLDTCNISNNVKGKNILLIDDVYTKTVNIVEDAIEALYKKGAKNVVFYALAKTVYKGY